MFEEKEQHVITRRRSLVLLGGTGAGLLAGGATRTIVSTASAAPTATLAGACVLTPEQEVGPYYVAYDRVRVQGNRSGFGFLGHLSSRLPTRSGRSPGRPDRKSTSRAGR